MDFQRALAFVLNHEGGYVNHPSDPGGETKFGISKRAYPHLNIKNLTYTDVSDIYRKDYWKPVKADQVPYPLAIVLFDSAVNCGVLRTVKWLQEAVGTVADGLYGPKTLAATLAADCNVVRDKVLSLRLQHYVRLNKPMFINGWINRSAELLLER